MKSYDLPDLPVGKNLRFYRQSNMRDWNRKKASFAKTSKSTARPPHTSSGYEVKRKAHKLRKHQAVGKNKRYQKHRDRRDPISIVSSANSIHASWKKELGALIRWYVHQRSHTDKYVNAMEEVERMYFESGCSNEKTKDMILRSFMKGHDMEMNIELPSQWIEIHMVVDYDSSSNVNLPADHNHTISSSGQGLRLKAYERSGEGPAYCHDTWTYVNVPEWAIGKTYHFEVINKSPLDLSCAMFIDTLEAAKNAPIPAFSTRTIKPNNKSGRYCESFQWSLHPAPRTKLCALPSLSSASHQNINIKIEPKTKPTSQRYNGKRPEYNTINNHRLDLLHYPDPTTFGWKFTGSVTESRVEFFEKRLNLGLVKMDFYYTTGTVKTIFYHPTNGRTVLYRNRTTSDIYKEILMNPRFQLNMKHRATGSHVNIVGVDENMVIENEFLDEEDTVTNSSMDIIMTSNGGEKNENINKNNSHAVSDTNSTMNENNKSTTPFYAKNEDYNFDKDGHTNRTSAMAKLEKKDEFTGWKEAVSGEWACVHAKFFMSTAHKKFVSKNNHKHHRQQQPKVPEPLPEMMQIVDLKATENATIGTKFKAVGPSSTGLKKAPNSSNVRMRRIYGLNDDRSWKGQPVFEYKLHYRPEKAANETIDDDDFDMSDDDNSDAEKNDRMEGSGSKETLAENLLAQIKKEKINQLNIWRQNLPTSKETDPVKKQKQKEENDSMFENCSSHINLSNTVQAVDESMKIYWDWIQKQSWAATSST